MRETLLAGKRPIGRILIDAGRADSRTTEIARLARQAQVPLVRVPAEALRRCVPSGLPHQGIVAEVAPKVYADPEELLSRIDRESLFVVLDQIQDPRNLGAILRTAAAAAVTGVFLPLRRAASIGPAAMRASAGGVEAVPIARVENLGRLLERIGERGVFRVGLDVGANELYDGIPVDRPLALVLGGEEKGLRASVRESCDLLVRIPIRGGVDSLNVSVAAGIALYEVLRARARAGEKGVS